jgi:hypothetical protein
MQSLPHIAAEAVSRASHRYDPAITQNVRVSFIIVLPLSTSSHRYSILLFRASPKIKLRVPASNQSLHRMLILVFSKLPAIFELYYTIILAIVTLWR